GLAETAARAAADISELDAMRTTLEAELVALAPEEIGRERIAGLKAEVGALRATLAEARGAHDQIRRDRVARAARLEGLGNERRHWRARPADAARQRAALAGRAEEARRELAALADKPAEIAARRAALLDQIGLAETARQQAADALAAAETALAAADRAAKAA